MTNSWGTGATWEGPVAAATWCDDLGAAPFGVEPACGGWIGAAHVVDVLSERCCGAEEVVMAGTITIEAPVVAAAPEPVGIESPAADVSGAPPIVAESIVAPPAAPVAGLAPLAPAPQPVPDLQAVEPASATEPAGDVELPPAEPPAPVAAPPEPIAAEPPGAVAPDATGQEPPPADVPAAEPVEENLFEEVTREPDAATSSALPAVEPPAAGVPAVEPVEPAAVSEPAPPEAGSEPDAGEPAVEPGAQVPEQAPAEASAVEPPRRWIDASGRYATVGALVAVRGAAVEIRTAAGRSIVVPLERLSEFDRGYADAAAARLAARGPGARDTAGL